MSSKIRVWAGDTDSGTPRACLIHGLTQGIGEYTRAQSVAEINCSML